MNSREEALEITLKQISEAQWKPEIVEKPDLATELVLYLMEKNTALYDELDRISAMLARYAGQPNHMGDIYKIAAATRAKYREDAKR